MIKIENPNYKNAFMTLLFYIILIFLIIFRYKIVRSGNTMMIIETTAPIVLPLVIMVLLLKNIWQFYYRTKTTLFSIVIHGTVFFILIFLTIKYLG